MAEHVRGQNRSNLKGSIQPFESVRSKSNSEFDSLRNNKGGDQTPSGGRDASRSGFYPRRNIRIDDFDGQLSDE